jgi:hypothetical protein
MRLIPPILLPGILLAGLGSLAAGAGGDRKGATTPVPAPATAAQEPPPFTFTGIRSVTVENVALLPCPPSFSEPLCLGADLAFERRDPRGAVSLDLVTYPVLPTLLEDAALDFGPQTPAALRAIRTSFESLGPVADERLHALADAWLPRLRAALPYRVMPHAILSAELEVALSRVADLYHRKTGRELVVTSGTRTPLDQARAMYLKLIIGEDLRRLYKKQDAAKEVKRVYDQGCARRKRSGETIADMARVIQRQVSEGVYLSPHLKQCAADIRSRIMRPSDKRAFQRAVEAVGGLRLLREETKPRHFHLELLVPGGDEEEGTNPFPSTGRPNFPTRSTPRN